MPVSILTPLQRRQYGRFAVTPGPEQIAKHCFLSPAEISKIVARRPHAWQQIGFTIQLMTVRFLGTFLDRQDVMNVPQILVAFAAQQLRLNEIPELRTYGRAIDMIKSHRDSIREQFGYSDFAEATIAFEPWLKARILRGGDTLLELFDLSTAWCIEKKVLLPAATTLERAVASAYDAALHGLWSELADIAKRDDRSGRLLTLLNVSAETGRTQIDVLMSQLMATSEKRAGQKRLGGLGQLDLAALMLAQICAVVLDEDVPAPDVRPVILSKTTRAEIASAIEAVRAQCRSNTQHDLLEALAARHRKTVGIVGPLIRTLTLRADPNGQQILGQVAFVKRIQDDPKSDLSGAPLDGLSKTWRAHVLDGNGRVRKHGYMAWEATRFGVVATRLREGLRRHDVYVARSVKWADIDGNLIPDDDTWQLGQKPQICTAFDLPTDGSGLITRFEVELTQAYADARRALGEDGARARFEGDDLIVASIVASIEAEPVPESRQLLRNRTNQMMPVVDLAEILMEVDRATGFTQSFVPSTNSLAREPGLNRTLCAALLADACNLPYSVVTSPEDPALTEERIAYVHQQFIRADTISTANRFLVSDQDRIELVRKHWGIGQVASADGMRFRVPVAAPNALPNRKYFGVGKGITYFSFTSDQFTGLHGIVIPRTMRDSLYLLDARLRLNTTLQPTEIMTDMASARNTPLRGCDAVFALFWFQGYEFRPRYVDMGDKRFWRFDSAADYGAWNAVSRHMLDRDRILEGYEGVLRLSASLREGKVQAHSVMQMLGGSGRALTALGRAAVEIGRVIKTKHMLKLATDEYYAQRIHAQLNFSNSFGAEFAEANLRFAASSRDAQPVFDERAGISVDGTDPVRLAADQNLTQIQNQAVAFDTL